jgi:hypothetical protein
MRADHNPNAVQWTSNRVYRCRNIGQELFEPDLIEQVLLARHVMVQRCLLNADCGGDFAGGGCGVALVPEEAGRSVKQSLRGLASSLRIDAFL